MADDTVSWTGVVAASSVLSADSSIWRGAGLSGAALDEAVGSDDDVGAPHAPMAPKVGRDTSEGQALRPAGNPATPLAALTSPPLEQLAPKPEFGHGCDPFGTSTWALS